MENKFKQKKSGFVILFAVTIASIVLAMGLGMANIAFKEYGFAYTAREANDAFFAADTGAECALQNDQVSDRVFVKNQSVGYVACHGVNYPLTGSWPDGSPGDWYFAMSGFGVSGTGCVNVHVNKDDQFEPPWVHTTITAGGYNIGDGGWNTCTYSGSSSQRIERELEVKYKNSGENFALGKPVGINGGPTSSTCTATGLDPGCLTNGAWSSWYDQAHPNAGNGSITDYIYEVDLQATRSLSQINIILCAQVHIPGSGGCYGFPYDRARDGLGIGTDDPTPYITSWTLEVWTGSSWYTCPTYCSGTIPGAKTISVSYSGGVSASKIRFTAHGPNDIGAWELLAY